MKKIIALIILLLISSPAYATDRKVSAMTYKATPAANDSVYVVDNSGTRASKQSSVAALLNSGAMSLTGLSDVTSTPRTAGNILVANGTNWVSVTMSGDATLAADGAISVVGGTGGASSLTGLSDVGSAIVTSGYVLVADGTKYQTVPMSGDATILASGATSVTGGSDGLTIGDGSAVGEVQFNELLTNGTNYISIKAPTSIASNRTCTLQDDSTPFDDCITPGSSSATGVIAGSYNAANITVNSTGDLTFAAQGQLTSLSDVASSTKTAGNHLVADGANFQSVAMTGDVTQTSAGVTSIGSSKVGPTQLASTTVTAGSYNAANITTDGDGRITFASQGQLTSLSDVSSSTKTAGNILVADGTNFASVALSGSCTITSAGVSTCSGSGGWTDNGVTVSNTTLTDDVLVGATSFTSASFAVSPGSGKAYLAGNVGIGKTNPNAALDLTGNTIVSGQSTVPILAGGSGATSTLTLKSTTATGTTDAISLGVGTNGGTVGMKIRHDGFVGFGTTNPSSNVEITNPLLLSGANAVITNSNTGSMGWSVVAGANTACTTTCTNAAVFGYDSGTNLIVGPSDATADVCVCAGPN